MVRSQSLYHNKRLQGTTTHFLRAWPGKKLYHNKRLQGTTTLPLVVIHVPQLYHNKRLQGTTTWNHWVSVRAGLYHNKRLQGTTTPAWMPSPARMIIPQQETSGNYNVLRPVLHYQGIIVLPSPFPLLCGVLAVTRLPPPVLFPPDIMNDTTDNSIFQLANHIKISVDCCAVYLLITIDKWGILLAYWRRCRYLRQVPRKGD